MLELKIVFPETPDMMICVYGQVVKIGNGEPEERRVSVRFSVIDEEIRDKIVKYVFDKQREIIRKSRRL
jgi:c-di-GMP-binding flagellar brake protein YcgR